MILYILLLLSACILIGICLNVMSVCLSVAFPKSVAEEILETVYNPLGRKFGHMTKIVTVRPYQLLTPIAPSKQYVI